jgi:hypothetical protein
MYISFAPQTQYSARENVLHSRIHKNNIVQIHQRLHLFPNLLLRVARQDLAECGAWVFGCGGFGRCHIGVGKGEMRYYVVWIEFWR